MYVTNNFKLEQTLVQSGLVSQSTELHFVDTRKNCWPGSGAEWPCTSCSRWRGRWCRCEQHTNFTFHYRHDDLDDLDVPIPWDGRLLLNKVNNRPSMTFTRSILISHLHVVVYQWEYVPSGNETLFHVLAVAIHPLGRGVSNGTASHTFRIWDPHHNTILS